MLLWTMHKVRFTLYTLDIALFILTLNDNNHNNNIQMAEKKTIEQIDNNHYKHAHWHKHIDCLDNKLQNALKLNRPQISILTCT